MPNVVADALGTADVDLMLADLELGSNGPRDVLGRAIILHEQADDYTSQPSGNAGARIACGVIGRTATAGTAPATDMGAAPVPATPPLDGVEPAPGPATTPETATPAPDDNGTQ
jgi:Cu-Zn family superoxide dismutase